MIKLSNIKDSRIETLDQYIYNLVLGNDNLILAGGAVRDSIFGDEISDYDLFFKGNSDNLEDIKGALIQDGYSNVFTCPKGELFTYMKGEDFKKPEDCIKVQLILKREYRDVEYLLNSFDFSVTYFALHKGFIYTSRQAIKDVRKKQMSLVNLEYPTSTINRLYKYRKKGYYTGDVIKEIVKRINQMDYNEDNDTLYVD